MEETGQDLKIEIEVVKKTQMEEFCKWTGATDASRTNRMLEMEERISGIDDVMKEIRSLVKENVKSNKFLTENIQEIWTPWKDQI